MFITWRIKAKETQKANGVMELLRESIIKSIFQSSTNKYDDFFNYFNEIHIPILETRLALSKTIFRARYSINSKILIDFSEFKCPSSNNSFSRIGKPGEIWFYTSNDYMACLAEMLPIWFKKFELGEKIKVTFGFWQIRQPIQVLVIPDHELKNKMAKAMELVKPYSDKDRKFWDFIGPYFYQASMENPNIYMLTSALISSMIYRSELDGNGIDGIAYPSIQHREETNIALKPIVIDKEKIYFEKAVEMTIQKLGDLNDLGLPKYVGPSNVREGILNRSSNKIEWA